jgi:hypothetical protein
LEPDRANSLRSYLEKIMVVEWLKVKVLSSDSSTAKKKKKRELPRLAFYVAINTSPLNTEPKA